MFLCLLCTPFANRCLVCTMHTQTTAVSVIKRLSLYEFTLWGRDLVSIVRKLAGYLQAWPRLPWTNPASGQSGTWTCKSNALTTRSRWARSIQPKFPEISVQNAMDRFGENGKVSKKLVHLLRWTTFPGWSSRNFGWMDHAQEIFSFFLFFSFSFFFLFFFFLFSVTDPFYYKYVLFHFNYRNKS